MMDNMSVIINVLESLAESMEELKIDSTSVEYFNGVSDCIRIVGIATNTLKASQKSKQPLTREG